MTVSCAYGHRFSLALAIAAVTLSSGCNGSGSAGLSSVQMTSSGSLAGNGASIVTNNAGSLVSNNAGGFVSNNSGGLVSNNAGGLVSNNAGGISGSLAGPGAGLIANNAAGIIANNASGLVSNNAGGLVSNNAGGLVSNNAGGLVSNNAGGYLLLDATPLTAVVPNATVSLLDEKGQSLADDVTTDASGHYAFGKVKPSGPLVFVRATYQSEGQTVSLAAATGAPREAGTTQVALDPGTTIVSKKVEEMVRTGASNVANLTPDSLGKMAAKLDGALNAKGIVAAVILPDNQAAKAFDGILNESPGIAKSLRDIVTTGGTTIALLDKTPDEPKKAAPPAPLPTSRAVEVQTFAGTGAAGDVGGNRANAQFRGPAGVTRDAAGNTFVAEADGNRIRKIDVSGNVTVLAGDGTAGTGDTLAADGSLAKLPPRFNNPTELVVDANGNVYVADTGNQKIRQIDAAGHVTTLAGDGAAGNTDGTGLTARFSSPTGLTLDGNGSLYVADSSNNRIRKINLTDPAHPVSTVSGSVAGYADGVGSAALFNAPESLAFDGKGSLVVADRGNYRIRKLGLDKSEVTTIAGNGKSGFADGLAANAQFTAPAGVAVDQSGSVYVADIGGQRIRVLTTDGFVLSLAGNGIPGFGDGNGKDARFNGPMHLFVDATGVLYVPDYFGGLIRKVK